MAKKVAPGALFTAHAEGKMKKASSMMKHMKGAIKDTGSFHGKSNALGHGGRAAQLKARGVPGGVIGNLARAAHAAPGQANYHGAKKRKASGGYTPLPSAFAPGQMASVARASGAFKPNPNAPQNYGPAMSRAYANTSTFGAAQKKKRKSSKKGVAKKAPEPMKQDLGLALKKKGKRFKGIECKMCKGSHLTSQHTSHMAKKKIALKAVKKAKSVTKKKSSK